MKRDPRYTVRLEACGFIRRQHVVRFCGAWIGSAPTRGLALEIRDTHARERAAQLAAWRADAEHTLAAARHGAAIHRARELQRSPAFLPA